MRRLLPAAFLLALLTPTVAAAQRTSLAPSFEISAMYDDNLFVSATDPRGSVVHRFGPRVEIDRRSANLSLVGRYEIDAEYLHALAQEGVQFARQLGSIRLGYRPHQRVGLEGDLVYLDTRAPVELGPATGFDRGRLRARRLSLTPSVSYAFDRRTRGDIGYALSRDYISDSITDAHVVQAGIAHRLTRADTASARLLLREFVFDADTTPPSQVAMLGWTRRFGRRTSASLSAGPRFRRAELEGIEATASVRHGIDRAELEGRYTRTETTSVGLPGALETDTAALSASLRLRPTVSSVTATYVRAHGAALDAEVFDIRAETTAQIHPWLSIGLSLTLTWQQLDTAATIGAAAGLRGSGQFVSHDLVAVRLVVAPPKPVEL